MDDEFQKAYDKALRLLTSRDHSVFELRSKLIQRGFSSDVARRVIEECRRLNLVDDERFARNYSEELKSRGCGGVKIKNSLRRKRIDAELIAEVMPDSPEEKADEYERARAIFLRKLESLKKESDPRKKKDKLCRHLASKGFSSGVVFRLVGELLR